jgi:hypothetical protein
MIASSEELTIAASEAVMTSASFRSVTSSIAEENHLRRAVVQFQPPGVEHHRAPPDLWKVVCDLEGVEKTVPGQNVFEQDAQFGNIPLLVV